MKNGLKCLGLMALLAGSLALVSGCDAKGKKTTGTTTPAADDAKADGDAKAADGDAKQADGDAKAADGDAAKKEGEEKK